PSTTATRMRPARTACLPCAVPGTIVPARAARPRRRIAASGRRILPVRALLRSGAAIGAGVRKPQDLSRDLAGLGELRIGRAGAFRRLRRRLLDRELIDHTQYLIRVLGREARDTEEVLALQVNDIQERSIPRTDRKSVVQGKSVAS